MIYQSRRMYINLNLMLVALTAGTGADWRHRQGEHRCGREGEVRAPQDIP